MEEYWLINGEIEDKYRHIKIYPFGSGFEYLIQWNSSEVSVIMKIDGIWYAENQVLFSVVNEIGNYIDLLDEE
jgi:hypothetical protein